VQLGVHAQFWHWQLVAHSHVVQLQLCAPAPAHWQALVVFVVSDMGPSRRDG
jgi:hypothetical protein